MIIKMHLLNSDIGQFLSNLGAVSDEEEDKFWGGGLARGAGSNFK